MTIKTYNMKTKYLIPQTEALDLRGERPMMWPAEGSPNATPHDAPQRGGFAPGGGDLGGVPAN